VPKLIQLISHIDDETALSADEQGNSLPTLFALDSQGRVWYLTSNAWYLLDVPFVDPDTKQRIVD
jgi:hypothetical protein